MWAWCQLVEGPLLCGVQEADPEKALFWLTSEVYIGRGNIGEGVNSKTWLFVHGINEYHVTPMCLALCQELWTQQRARHHHPCSMGLDIYHPGSYGATPQ